MAEINSEKTGHEVFISYANDKSDSSKIDDRKVADMICSALEAENIRCWIDHRDIIPGDDWQDAMADAVEKAKLVVLVFSSNADKSQWVKDETAIARDKKIRIIPFQIENVPSCGVFSALRARCQWIEAYILPWEKHLDRLVRAVKIHLGKGTPLQLELDRLEDKKKTKGETRNAKPHKLRLFILIVILLITSMLFVKEQFLDKSLVWKFFNPFSSLINKKAKSIMINSKGFWEADFGDDIIMVYIPEGEFIMGQTDEEKQWLIGKVGQKSYDLYYSDERPYHKVFLPGYWMGKTEVTFVQYDKFCENTGGNKPNDFGWGRGTLPVIHVSWDDADNYCKWLSKKKELKFKLPSEAQWEKAARGTDARWYPWGNHPIYYENKWYANHMAYDTENRRGEDGYPETSPVGSYPCGDSPYGLQDMAGNVWEWCNDWYNIDLYRFNSSKNPTGPLKGSDRVMRGGSFFHHSDAIRCANREKFTPSDRSNALGFRLCMVNK